MATKNFDPDERLRLFEPDSNSPYDDVDTDRSAQNELRRTRRRSRGDHPSTIDPEDLGAYTGCRADKLDFG